MGDENAISSYQLAVAAEQNIKEGEYWLNKLSGDLIKTNFHYDYKRKDGDWRRMEEEEFLFPQSLASKSIKLSQAADVKLHMILVTGLFILLKKYSNKTNNQVMIGSPLLKQKIESGFINTVLVFRNEVQENTTFKELLLQVRNTIIQANKNQNYPMEKLLDRLNMPMVGNESPLFDVVISLENIYDKRFIQHIHYNMSFSFLRTGESIAGQVEYNSLLYRQHTIKQIIRHYMHVLTQGISDLDVKLSHIELLAEEERKQVLLDFNRTDSDYPPDKTLIRLFEEQVEKESDRIALNSSMAAGMPGDAHITYLQLNEKSNRLAHQLRAKGVKPDTIVGIMAEPSIEMMIGLMAILKAGGAYLPLDPENPTNRLTKMLKESKASILLTKSEFLALHDFTIYQHQDLTTREPIVTASRERITDMDRLPLPDRSLIDYNKYNQNIGYAGVKHTISLEATRGCPFHCTYCHQIFPSKQVSRSAENIFSEVQYYYNLGVRRFSIIDDIFNLRIKNSSQFFTSIIKNGLNKDIQLFFSAGLRGDILTPDYIDLMMEAGTVSMSPALETASPRLQKLIRKHLNLERFRRNIEYICEKYPQVITELFIMHGFPTETEEEVWQTMDFVKSLKWIHFPYINILRIYSSTEMAKFAMENGISYQSIIRSEDLALHELPETLPFPTSFTIKMQTQFLNEYFLCKERLLHVLPYQMQVMTEDELVQKYNSYLPVDIKHFSRLLQFAEIKAEELPTKRFLDENHMCVPGLNEKLKKDSIIEIPDHDALRVLLLDLDLYFSHEADILYDLVDEPLGLIRLMTQLKQQFGTSINGKIAKSRIDFNNYKELKALLKDFKPDVIGIRTLTFYRDFIYNTVSHMRQWGINVPIIAGGPHATTNYQEVLQDGNIDLIVLGEGEMTLVELIGKILENQKQLPANEILEKIPGLAFIPYTGTDKSKKRGEAPQEFAREIIILDTDNQQDAIVSHVPAENPGKINQPGDLAYVIYTSGSTGNPKGVMVEHRNVAAYLHAFYQEFDIRSEDTVIQLAPYFFDVFVEEVFSILLKGGKIIIPDYSVMMDIDLLCRLILKQHVNFIDCTPLLLNEFNKFISKLPIENIFKGMPIIISGGDVLKKEYVDYFLKVGNVYNTYGPTETTVCATYYRYNPGENQDNIPTAASIPIGKPIANYNVYILYENDNPVPIGVTGQLCISGPGVTRGYLNQPELTAEKYCLRQPGGTLFEKTAPPGPPRKNFLLFPPHLLHSPYSPIYRSGDLARWLPDGNIEFTGRKDHQVKIRGYRIEIGEIEQQLSNNPEIKESVVITREDKDGNKYLCAYFVSDNEMQTPDPSRFLTAALPDYMIPSFFVPLERIPLSPNGKIDRKALPEPVAIDVEKYIPPQNPLQERMQKIWQEAFDLEKIGINDNFFTIGGHSLKGVQLINEIHKEFNVRIPLAELFNTPTIKGLSHYIAGTVKDKHTSPEPVEKKEYYTLSSAQKRQYVLQQMDLESTGYNMPIIISLDFDVNREQINRTFTMLIHRHESFRTSFEMHHEEPVQKIIPPHETPFRMDCYETDETGAKHLINNFVKPFDLGQAPLLHVGFLKIIENEQYVLIVDMHHIIMDAVSLEIFTREFRAIYEKEELPPLKIQYKDFSQWQNNQNEKESIKKQEEYWLKQFDLEIPVLNLPLDYKRPAIQSFEGNHISFAISKEETEAIRSLASKEDLTLYMLLLAVFNVLLAKLSANEDIIVGTVTAGRSRADLKQVIGMFVNTLALRNYPRGQKTFREFLQEVKEKTLEAFENQDCPFEDMVEKSGAKRDASRNPLFDVVFTLETMEGETGEIARRSNRETKQSYEYDYRTAKFDLILNAIQGEDNFSFSMTYCTKLFKKETIQRYSTYFKKIISGILKNSEINISKIEFMPEEEKNQLLFDFNQPGKEYPTGKTIHGLFEKQVEQTPDRVAVVGSKQAAISKEGTGGLAPVYITYHELNQKSNQLAGVLGHKGVKPGDIIGLMVGRSLEMPIGILGILKSGSAYLPIDPDYPEERINYILKDSSVKFLMTAPDLVEKFEKLLIVNCQLLMVNEKPPYRRRLNNPPKEANSINNYQLTINNLQLEKANLAYVIYTSGTTGKPKGVLIQHRSAVNTLVCRKEEYRMNSNHTALQLFSYAFDGFVTSFFTPVISGAKVVLLSGGSEKDITNIKQTIVKNKVTHFISVPLLYQAIIENMNAQESASLKVVTLAGDKVSTYTLAITKEKNTRIEIVNEYGITESSVMSTIFRHQEKENEIRIGKPIWNTKIYILDRDYLLQPPGIPGELCIAGEGIARGYLNNPHLTAEKFDHDKKNKSFCGGFRGAVFSKSAPLAAGGKIYRTGDLARFLHDGNIELLGRIDHQVKIRGFRIEPGEIENQLLLREDISKAVVIDKNDEIGNKYLCAYIVLNQEAALEKTTINTELKAYLSHLLPAYMIPAFFLQINHIPLTQNGKVDRKSLPEPGAGTGIEYVAPRNEIEQKLTGIWSEVLKGHATATHHPNIGINDNFFNLGGHSLTATIMVEKIHRWLHIRVPLVEIFRIPTIKQLAQYIRDAEMKTGISRVEDENLVLLRKKHNSANHFFFVHDGSGEIEGYIEFCQYLDTNTQFNWWGIRADGIKNYTPQNITIEEIAHHYVKKVKKVQTSGPYFIGGWSMGGTIAFEMANQLEELKEEIACLALIDSPGPPVCTHGNEHIRSFTIETEKNFIKKYFQDREIQEKLENLTDIYDLWSFITDYLELKNFNLEMIKQVLMEYEAHVVPNYNQLDISQLINYLNRGRTFHNARALYIPSGKIHAPVHYFAASQSPKILKKSWNEYCLKSINFYEITGDHYSIFQVPIVKEFAGILSKMINI